jgi:HK97 family phage major capsid protein
VPNETLIKSLRRELADTWEEAKQLNDRTADGGKFTAEQEKIWQMLNVRMDETRERITDLEETAEREKDLDEQREKFEAVVRPPEPEKRAGREKDLETRMLEFARAGLPGADYAPRAIEIKISGQDKKPIHEQRDLSKGVTTLGGFTVPTGFIATLYEQLVEFAAVRQTGATIYTTDSGESLLVPKATAHGSAALVTEAASIAGTDPTFAQQTLLAYKYGQIIKVSNELATDSGINLLDYLARSAGRNLGLASGAHFVTGTGTGQPEGVQTNVTTGKQGIAGQTLTVLADDLFDVYHSIVSGYRGRGVWLMRDATLASIRKLKDTTNQYLWQPGMQQGIPDSLLGRPVVTDPTMPAMGVSVKSILFGDFSAYYAIRDVSTLRFERSDDFLFGNDQIAFRALLRTDGKPMDATAVKAYQNSAT